MYEPCNLELPHVTVQYALIAYLLGSIPFGLLLTKIFTKTDLRSIGSGNIGATNVLRSGNKILAALTLFLDGLKGSILIIFLSVNVSFFSLMYTHCGEIRLQNGNINNEFVSAYFEHFRIQVISLGLIAILGHCYPVWLKFKGGKGVATALGVFLAATPWAGLAACAAWLAVAFATKISSLAALIALLTAPVVTYLIYGPEPAAIALLITALVWWRHRENIKRLLNGTEPKVSFKKEK